MNKKKTGFFKEETEFCNGKLKYSDNYDFLICDKCKSRIAIERAYHQVGIFYGDSNKLITVSDSFEKWKENTIEDYCRTAMSEIESDPDYEVTNNNIKMRKEDTAMYTKVIDGKTCRSMRGYWIPMDLISGKNAINLTSLKTGKIKATDLLTKNGYDLDKYFVVPETTNPQTDNDSNVPDGFDSYAAIKATAAETLKKILHVAAMTGKNNICIMSDCINWNGLNPKSDSFYQVFKKMRESDDIVVGRYDMAGGYYSIKLRDDIEISDDEDTPNRDYDIDNTAVFVNNGTCKSVYVHDYNYSDGYVSLSDVNSKISKSEIEELMKNSLAYSVTLITPPEDISLQKVDNRDYDDVELDDDDEDEDEEEYRISSEEKSEIVENTVLRVEDFSDIRKRISYADDDIELADDDDEDEDCTVDDEVKRFIVNLDNISDVLFDLIHGVRGKGRERLNADNAHYIADQFRLLKVVKDIPVSVQSVEDELNQFIFGQDQSAGVVCTSEFTTDDYASILNYIIDPRYVAYVDQEFDDYIFIRDTNATSGDAEPERADNDDDEEEYRISSEEKSEIAEATVLKDFSDIRIRYADDDIELAADTDDKPKHAFELLPPDDVNVDDEDDDQPSDEANEYEAYLKNEQSRILSNIISDMEEISSDDTNSTAIKSISDAIAAIAAILLKK